jgi:hypothetical protein
MSGRGGALWQWTEKAVPLLVCFFALQVHGWALVAGVMIRGGGCESK